MEKQQYHNFSLKAKEVLIDASITNEPNNVGGFLRGDHFKNIKVHGDVETGKRDFLITLVCKTTWIRLAAGQDLTS